MRPEMERGDSLVEILVAVAIISLSLTILVTALSTGFYGVRSSRHLTQANNLAASQMESIKVAAYADVAGGTYPSVTAPPGYTIDVTQRQVETGLLAITVTASYDGEPLTVVSNFKVDR